MSLSEQYYYHAHAIENSNAFYKLYIIIEMYSKGECEDGTKAQEKYVFMSKWLA